MPNSKASLRKHFLQIRKSIPEPEAIISARNAADNFLKSISIKGVKTIAFYYPINGEIDPMPLCEGILSGKLASKQKDINFSLPTITDKDKGLVFHPWKLGGKLINNTLYPQLLESLAQDDHVIPDIIIVPLVAFDENCHRLGYGAGFYDRTIAKLRDEVIDKKTSPSHSLPITVGYAYECQKSNTPLPTYAHDIRLDFIVTDKCVYSNG